MYTTLDQMNAKLKPCPLCGDKVKITDVLELSNSCCMRITCYNCCLELQYTQYWNMVEVKDEFGNTYYERGMPITEDAITRWNTRVGDGSYVSK